MNKLYVENIAQRFAEIFVKFRIRLRGKACNENACVVVPAFERLGGRGVPLKSVENGGWCDGLEYVAGNDFKDSETRSISVSKSSSIC